MFMLCSMEMLPEDCGLEDGPVDPDLAWTRWALGSLGELVEIGLRSARLTATEQLATPINRTKPDFALAQVRLARSVRLSIAMSQRVRENYQVARTARRSPRRRRRPRRPTLWRLKPRRLLSASPGRSRASP
jgi:hypothetical protein